MDSRFVHSLLTLRKSYIKGRSWVSMWEFMEAATPNHPEYLDAVTIKERLKAKKSKHSHSIISILTLL